MANVATITELLSKPNVIYEIAKSIQTGTCEIKVEDDKVVIIKIDRTIKYRA